MVAMVGFARAVSDGVAVAYLADVFVAPAARGIGLGVGLVDAMIVQGPGRGFRWMLHTKDCSRPVPKIRIQRTAQHLPRTSKQPPVTTHNKPAAVSDRENGPKRLISRKTRHLPAPPIPHP